MVHIIHSMQEIKVVLFAITAQWGNERVKVICAVSKTLQSLQSIWNFNEKDNNLLVAKYLWRTLTTFATDASFWQHLIAKR